MPPLAQVGVVVVVVDVVVVVVVLLVVVDVVVVVVTLVVVVVAAPVVVVVVAPVGQMPVTWPMPSTVTSSLTHSSSISASMLAAIPSPVQGLTALKAAVNFMLALSRQPPGALSTGRPFAAALA